MANLFIDRGNLGDSPELKHVQRPDGSSFTVATMRVRFSRWKQTDSGEIEQVGGFWRTVEIYGRKAEDCATHLRKGARVLVLGRVEEFQVKDEAGNPVEVYKIVAQEIAPLLSRVESISFISARARPEADATEADADAHSAIA